MANRKTRNEKHQPETSTVAEVEPVEVAVEEAPVESVEPQAEEAQESANTVTEEPSVEEILAAAEAQKAEEVDLLAASKKTVNPLDDDDELLLKAADSKLEETEAYGIFKQEEGVVSWTISNFLDPEGKQYGKRELRANPPVLTLESSTGDKADFVLSKDFAGSLATVIERVHFGFYGLDKKPKKKFTGATAKQAVVDAVGARPLQVGAFLVMALVVIVGLVAS